MPMCLIIRNHSGVDVAHAIEEDEVKALVKKKEAVYLEGIIYRATVQEGAEEPAPKKKKARKKKSTYKTKVTDAE